MEEYKWYFFVECDIINSYSYCCFYGHVVNVRAFSYSDVIKVDGTRGNPGLITNPSLLVSIDSQLNNIKFTIWYNNLPDEIRNSLPF